MGVRGLSTFVNENQSLLGQHKLHDCRVIIDANNFMYYLFLHHKLSFKLGGDYDQYARKCKHFFNILRECNVKPYVVFDGGYHPDDRKLPTILHRRQCRIYDVDRICSRGWGAVLPILAIETFIQTLEELDIPHVSCHFEADREIAVLARRWGCPVLSNDSDFFIYNLEGGVIPLEYMNLTLCVCNSKSGDAVVLESSHSLSEDDFKYIPVKLYHYTKFVQKYNKEVHQLVLPVFASLMGNDYVEPKLLLRFYSYVGVPTGERLKFRVTDKKNSRLIACLYWLDRISSKESENIFDGMLEYIPKDIRDEVRIKLNRSLEDYCNINEFASIDVEKFLNCYELPKSVRNLELFVFPELLDYEENSVPQWLVSAFRRCRIGLALQNAIVLHRVIQYCQIELMGKLTTYSCSKRIREISYGLFFQPSTAKDSNKTSSRESHIVEYDRCNKMVKKFFVTPVRLEINQWDIHTPPSSDNQKDRLKILFAAVNFTQHSALSKHSFSNTIHLIISILCLWIKEADPKVSKGAVMSMLATILYLNVRTLHWYKNKLKSANQYPSKPCIFNDVEETFNLSEEEQVDHFVKQMEKYTKKPEKKERKPRDYRIVHGYSQFQAILKDTILLNQLLACPVPMLSPGLMYSGCTVYNLCIELDHRSKPDLFIGDIMEMNSPLHLLFTNILQGVVEICTDSIEVKSNQPRKKQKKKNKKKSERETQKQADSSDIDSPESGQVNVTSDLTMDNRFALLNLDE